jgi:hypothetical protein
VFSGVFTVEEVYGVGDKGAGDTKTVEVQTLLDSISDRVHEICPFSSRSFFLVRSKSFGLGTTLVMYQVIRISKLLDVKLK